MCCFYNHKRHIYSFIWIIGIRCLFSTAEFDENSFLETSSEKHLDLLWPSLKGKLYFMLVWRVQSRQLANPQRSNEGIIFEEKLCLSVFISFCRTNYNQVILLIILPYAICDLTNYCVFYDCGIVQKNWFWLLYNCSVFFKDMLRHQRIFWWYS